MKGGPIGAAAAGKGQQHRAVGLLRRALLIVGGTRYVPCSVTPLGMLSVP